MITLDPNRKRQLTFKGRDVCTVFNNGPLPIDEVWMSYRHVRFKCPCGCGKDVLILRNVPENQSDPRPKWEAHISNGVPNISPSIRDLGYCFAHYFIRNGVVEFCSDSGVKV